MRFQAGHVPLLQAGRFNLGICCDVLTGQARPLSSPGWRVTSAWRFDSGMHKSLLDNSRADRRGMLIASLCFLHCIAGPVLLSFAGLASLISISEKLEPLFLLGSAVMGVIALVPGYRKKHRRTSCLVLFASGFVCLFLRRHVGWRAIAIEPVTVALGASLIIGAHVLNLKFSKRCECCDRLSEEIPEQSHECSGGPSSE